MSALLALRDALAKEYLDDDQIRNVAIECGIKPGSIRLHATPETSWQTILNRLAGRPSGLDRLRVYVIEDKNEHIEALIDAFKFELPGSEGGQRNGLSDPIAWPPYIGSSSFVGRTEQIERLSSWAADTNTNPVMLVHAIGGMGKSQLTWHWLQECSTNVRSNWEGRIWYSFYEGGASMHDFCVRAIAHMDGVNPEDLWKQHFQELIEKLVYRLRTKPWLIVLDGLERALVAYNRIDCAHMLDEAVDKAEDEIATREPRETIRKEDGDLLVALLGSSPSKALITSRLVPTSLTRDELPLAGIQLESLGGLKPEDAEIMLRAREISGDSSNIRAFLERSCGCHPLVVGVIAGLVHNHDPSPDDFDSWLTDPMGGREFQAGDFDLIQRRTDILEKAISDLNVESRRLLLIMSLLSGAEDYETIRSIHDSLTAANEQTATRRRGVGQQFAPLRDLRKRGLVQYDRTEKQYDLHAVVRSVASTRASETDKSSTGAAVIDYCTARAPASFDGATCLADVADQIQIIRAYLMLNRKQEACNAYLGKICNVLDFRMEAVPETLEILQPFFSDGWGNLPPVIDERSATHMATHAAKALNRAGFSELAGSLAKALILNAIGRRDQINCLEGLLSYEKTLRGSTAAWYRTAEIILRMRRFNSRSTSYLHDAMVFYTKIGDYRRAESIWASKPPHLHEDSHHRGACDLRYAELMLRQGRLEEKRLVKMRDAVLASQNSSMIIGMWELLGEWSMSGGAYLNARDYFSKAIERAHSVGREAPSYIASMYLAELHLGKEKDAVRSEAERLSELSDPPNLSLAKLWLALGDGDRAQDHALKAYVKAWGPGVPYVARFNLDQSAEILIDLGCEVPDLPVDHSLSADEQELLDQVDEYIKRDLENV